MSDIRPTINIFERMLSWPLFVGLSSSDIKKVAADRHLLFKKYKPSEIIIERRQPSQSLIMIISGRVKAITQASDNTYSVEEELVSPMMIEPERLFGMNQNYHSSYVSVTDSSSIEISKHDLSCMFSDYEIIRFNFLNAISTLAQRGQTLSWQHKTPEIERKIIEFVRLRIKHSAGRKTLHISIQTLATNIGESRLNTSKALHSLANNNLISMYRNVIEIEDMGLLIGLVRKFKNNAISIK